MDLEKKAKADVQKNRSDFQANASYWEEQQQGTMQELTATRRDLQESRSKAKIMVEGKTKMEMEIISGRTECSKLEGEVHRLREHFKKTENSNQDMQERINIMETSTAEATQAANRLKKRIAELEDGVSKKNATIEQLHVDIEQVERDGLNEVRRLRGQLNASETELQELRETLPIMQKEMAKDKENFSKLQSTTTSNVSGLLEELKVSLPSAQHSVPHLFVCILHRTSSLHASISPPECQI